ncbi:MAG: DUF429 domain-containing protein [Planctomycetota bacterium]|nr:MAG: DUF429 domain-containing protein [Planctomycetota bacterium]
MGSTVIGIDGCRAGWVVCTLDRDGVATLRIEPDLARAVGSAPYADLALVDMPIGLVERGVRAADLAAKRLLRRWNARVFLTPARGVFDCDSYPDANARSRELTGKGLSKQMWHIMPKIRAVDAELARHPWLAGVIRECHPEICFWGLSGSVIAENKRTEAGAARRLAVLAQIVPDAEAVVARAMKQSLRKEVARDDLIDAMVCAVTAAGVWDGSLRTLPEQPERDGRGLAMEMVYRDKAAIR